MHLYPLTIEQAVAVIYVLVLLMFCYLVIAPIVFGLARFAIDTLRQFRFISRETYESIVWW